MKLPNFFHESQSLLHTPSMPLAFQYVKQHCVEKINKTLFPVPAAFQKEIPTAQDRTKAHQLISPFLKFHPLANQRESSEDYTSLFLEHIAIQKRLLNSTVPLETLVNTQVHAMHCALRSESFTSLYLFNAKRRGYVVAEYIQKKRSLLQLCWLTEMMKSKLQSHRKLHDIFRRGIDSEVLQDYKNKTLSRHWDLQGKTVDAVLFQQVFEMHLLKANYPTVIQILERVHDDWTGVLELLRTTEKFDTEFQEIHRSQKTFPKILSRELLARTFTLKEGELPLVFAYPQDDLSSPVERMMMALYGSELQPRGAQFLDLHLGHLSSKENNKVLVGHLKEIAQLCDAMSYDGEHWQTAGPLPMNLFYNLVSVDENLAKGENNHLIPSTALQQEYFQYLLHK